jgi:hypothetical protein
MVNSTHTHNTHRAAPHSVHPLAMLGTHIFSVFFFFLLLGDIFHRKWHPVSFGIVVIKLLLSYEHSWNPTPVHNMKLHLEAFYLYLLIMIGATASILQHACMWYSFFFMDFICLQWFVSVSLLFSLSNTSHWILIFRFSELNRWHITTSHLMFTLRIKLTPEKPFSTTTRIYDCHHRHRHHNHHHHHFGG